LAEDVRLESDRGSDQCSIPNAQFSSEVDAGLPNVPPMQDKIALSDQFEERHLSDENWELNIGQILPSPGQILPSPHSAKLFLRENQG
jgi:hypothetical protein